MDNYYIIENFVSFDRYGFLTEEPNGAEKKSYETRGEKSRMAPPDYQSTEVLQTECIRPFINR